LDNTAIETDRKIPTIVSLYRLQQENVWKENFTSLLLFIMKQIRLLTVENSLFSTPTL